MQLGNLPDLCKRFFMKKILVCNYLERKVVQIFFKFFGDSV